MVHSAWRSLIVLLWASLGMASTNECLIGFSLQGVSPFESTDWVGRTTCDGTLAAANVVTNWCTAAYDYSCFWSVLDCATSTDTDASCTCQACGGMPPNLDDYMIELAIWDRVRCAVYAEEVAGYDVTPCVEALVDTMSMPGIDEEWTAPAVAHTQCTAIEYGNYYSDDGCSYAGTPRSSTEAFDDDATSLVPTDECLIGFSLQGISPFESADWVGRTTCDGTLAAANVVTNWCTAAYDYSCIWSVLDCATSTDTDASCTCQACGGMPPNLDDYMTELAIWDRVRCAVYAEEVAGYDVTPCVEALVDTMSMPGIDEEWTAPAVAHTQCIAIEYGNYYSDDECSYAGTPRSSTEAFDDGPTTSITPAPGAGVPITPAPGVAPEAAATPVPSQAPEEVTTAPTLEVAATSAPATAAPEVAGSDSDSDPLRTPAPEVASSGSTLGPPATPTPSGSSPGQSPVGSPTTAPALDNGESTSEGGSGVSAEIAIGIASVVVAFLGIVTGILWGSASTVYFNCKCCVGSGSGPVVAVGTGAPSAKWLPFRMTSNARVTPPAANFAMPVGPGAIVPAIVPAVTSGLEAIVWTPVAAGTGMTLSLTIDGRSYVFKSSASATLEDGRRIIVGGINRARAIEGETIGRVVDVVTVNESCELATKYPSSGHFRVIRRCASHSSSLATYAVVEAAMGCIMVVR